MKAGTFFIISNIILVAVAIFFSWHPYVFMCGVIVLATINACITLEIHHRQNKIEEEENKDE